MALSVTSGSGTGGEQSNPQTATGASNSSVLSGNVQPGTPSNDLTSSNGLSLSQTPVTMVSLGARTGPAQTPANPSPHHANPLLLGLVVLLFVAAAAIFAVITKSGKKYNQY